MAILKRFPYKKNRQKMAAVLKLFMSVQAEQEVHLDILLKRHH